MTMPLAYQGHINRELKDSANQNRLSGGKKSFMNMILKEVAFIYLCVYVCIWWSDYLYATIEGIYFP